MVWYFHASGRKHYGTDTSWQRHDHARGASSNTAIAGFTLGAERKVRDQSKNRGEIAEASDCRGSEDRSQKAALTLTERAVHAMALKAHAPPAIADLAGQAADAMIPAGILHAAAHFAATRAMRVAMADANRLAFRQDDITTEHFHRPVQRMAQPTRTPANQNLLSPHRQNRLDLNHHEAPAHNRKAGGHVLLKHVDPTEAYIERRFTKERHPVISFFISKEEAERAIHAVLRDHSHKIDAWLMDARDGSSVHVEGHLSGSGAIVVENTDRARKAARHIRVTITKKEHNGMIYYVQTVRLY